MEAWPPAAFMIYEVVLDCRELWPRTDGPRCPVTITVLGSDPETTSTLAGDSLNLGSSLLVLLEESVIAWREEGRREVWMPVGGPQGIFAVADDQSLKNLSPSLAGWHPSVIELVEDLAALR
jgi:hypothetical protein